MVTITKPPLHTEQEMVELRKSYRAGTNQRWECWTDNYNGWYKLPAFFEPGWFMDTLYRRIK